jgi:predicted metal-dependent peptidase
MISATPSRTHPGIKVYNKAKARLLTDKKTGFYGALLCDTPVFYVENEPEMSTLAVDQAGNMYIDLDFVASMDAGQLVFGLVHEMEHLLGLHPARLAGRDPDGWNWATDAVINDMLREQKIGTWITAVNIIDVPGAREFTADAMYRGGEGTPKPQGGGDPDKGDMSGDLIKGDASQGLECPRPMSKAEKQEVSAEVKGKVAKAAQIAKMQGSLSGELEARVAAMLEVKTPWFDILEDHMTEVAATDYSWSRPNRRLISQNTYLPTLSNVAQMGIVVVGVDISRSIKDDERAAFAGHLNRIMETCAPSKLHVMYTDTKVRVHDEYTRDELPFEMKPLSSGATDMRSIFNLANTLDEEIAACIILTDGMSPWPDHEQDYPVFVLCTTKHKFDYGEIIRFEMEQ